MTLMLCLDLFTCMYAPFFSEMDPYGRKESIYRKHMKIEEISPCIRRVSELLFSDNSREAAKHDQRPRLQNDSRGVHVGEWNMTSKRCLHRHLVKLLEDVCLDVREDIL